MSPYVSASDLRTVLEWTPENRLQRYDNARANLEAALARSAPRRKPKPSKRDETARIRAAVFERARGHCECGCGADLGLDHFPFPPSMDHFFGRGKAPQSVDNCWALAWGCDQGKTANYPSARHWLKRFIAHCERHGYRAEAERARARLEGMVAVREAESLRAKGLTREGK